jgi:hypothetical protein
VVLRGLRDSKKKSTEFERAIMVAPKNKSCRRLSLARPAGCRDAECFGGRAAAQVGSIAQRAASAAPQDHLPAAVSVV